MRTIEINDDEFTCLALHLKMKDEGYDYMSLDNTIIFMRNKDKIKMPTQTTLFKSEAIALFKKHMPDASGAESFINFYIAAGMLEVEEEEEEKPIFEIIVKGQFGYHVKIWPNGRTEGIEGTVINRIPEYLIENNA